MSRSRLDEPRTSTAVDRELPETAPGATAESSLSFSPTSPGSSNKQDSFEALLREIAAGTVLTPPLPQQGDMIAGKYRIEEKLGQGGMGAVFRATHTISDKQVAIKWMLNTNSNQRGRNRFIREARAAARIDHPNVVDVYDIAQDGSRGLYMVMQLLRGESLAQRIARGSMSIGETIDILLPAMRGVAAVHAAGVVHRDLKPDNIFLCETKPGVRTHAKVLDFGIASVIEHADAHATPTSDGALLGTLAYMSPEQIEDSRSVDARADVYAFGVILYECLAGQVPFRARNDHALVQAIVAGETAAPSTLRPELPAALTQVVMRALARREQRYADIESLMSALEPWSSLVEAAPLTESVRELAPQRPRTGKTFTIIALAAIALGAYGWWHTTHGPERADRAPSREPSVLPPAVTPVPARPSAREGALSPPEPAARHEAATEPDTAAQHDAAVPALSRPRARTPVAPVVPPPSQPASPPARSGKIVIEEL